MIRSGWRWWVLLSVQAAALVAMAMLLRVGLAPAHDWYTGLKVPDTELFCCGEKDCHPVPDQESPSGGEPKVLIDGAWHVVPPNLVLSMFSPDGQTHQATYARAVEDANDRALRSSQAWTDGATRFLQGYVAESEDAAAATERAFANAFRGAEDSLGGFAGSGLVPDDVPIIARRGELVVPAERVVREETTAREQRPITVVVNVTAADASSFRASQGQIAADTARAIDRASRNR
jgi:hypothetical protein